MNKLKRKKNSSAVTEMLDEVIEKIKTKEERKEHQRKERREKEREKLINREPKLGKIKFSEVEENEMDIGDVLPANELPSSLRNIKVKSSLMRDRFRSLQKRSLIEPRVPHIPKVQSSNRKIFTKPSMRDEWHT
eukprot:TRINITY_DN8531_c0_g1_i1.p1 TRINITY_DN8531_c0_g1~~TRINITY_DN8531_c0_g1_i1.p1  ORF type:complete len:134 (-),score=53.90 TRINITY_DN8531_c0_g1_i1:142-543(-)